MLDHYSNALGKGPSSHASNRLSNCAPGRDRGDMIADDGYRCRKPRQYRHFRDSVWSSGQAETVNQPAWTKAAILQLPPPRFPIGIAAHSHSYPSEELGTSGLKGRGHGQRAPQGTYPRERRASPLPMGARLYYQTSTGKWVGRRCALDTIDMTGQAHCPRSLFSTISPKWT